MEINVNLYIYSSIIRNICTLMAATFLEQRHMGFLKRLIELLREQ